MKNQDRLFAFLRRMEDLGLRNAPLKQTDLSLPQLGLLMCLGREPGSSVNEVAETMGLTPPTVSVALRRMEKGGWLRRESDPQDKRVTHHFLTSKALNVMEKVKAHRNERIGAFLNALEPDEQEQLISLLEKATRNLEGTDSE